AAYRARNLVTLPTIMRVHQGDVNGQVASETHLSYDESAVSSEPNIINWIDPSTTYRGNVTTMSHWLDTTNSYLSTHVAYDQAGNAVSATDALGNTATTSYADSFSDNVNRNTYA